jgi:Saccharopine dehydrogenase NADP binding domain
MSLRNVFILLIATWRPLQSSKPANNILVLGGSGRVGGSAVRALHDKFGDGLNICVGGRDRKNWDDYLRRLGRDLHGVRFEEVDINNQHRLNELISKNDLIVHTAGPFQGIRVPSVLEAAITHGKSYMDVCDDVALSRIARSQGYQAEAKRRGTAAILSTGIWPGGSSLFAQKVISRAGGQSQVEKVTFSFFTAGSGNAGPTILTATFLILGEDVLTYINDEPIYKKSATDTRSVDFGKGIGIRDVVRLNLIECESCHESGISTVETYFGTAPPLWNKLFALMANLIPQKVLQDRSAMTLLAKVSLPMVRLVDTLVGSTNGIRVDVTTKSGEVFTGLLTHNDLEKSVGDAIAAFATQMLRGSVPPGVYFPEEVPGIAFRDEILADISADAISYSIDKNL